MQKVVTFLERNVQWIALGLGVVFMLLMAYTYLLSPPTIQVDPRSPALTPGAVDEYILTHTAKDLKQKIDDPARIDLPLKDSKTELVKHFEPPVQLGPTDTIVKVPNGIRPPQPNGGQFSLPQFAAAKPTDRRTGRSQVLLAAQPAADKPADVVKPVRRPPAGAAAGAPADNRETRDVDWVSLLFRVSMEEMTQAFEAAKLPPDASRTRFLRVTLVRQEMQQNGQWGPETVVNPLPGVQLPPLPADNANKADQFNYLAAVQPNLPVILQPALDVVPGTGTQWIWPGSPEPAQANPVRPVAAPPVPPPGGGLPPLPLPAPGGGLPPLPAPGRVGPPMLPPGAPPGMPGLAPQGIPELAPAPGMPMMPPMPANAADPNQALPGANTQDGMFSPVEVADFDILAHDIGVQPGRTYRYKLRYTVLNPLWSGIAGHVPNVPPAVANKFAVTSPDSAWSEPIQIPQRVQFWLAGADVRKGQATFEVFAWDGTKGAWGVSRVTVSPGDAIGKSSWTLVDVRGRIDRAVVLIADQNGQTFRRDPKVDPTDPEYLKMRDQTVGTAMVPGGPAVPSATAGP